MKQAGLTVGGFYEHFGSRDQLSHEILKTVAQFVKNLAATSLPVD
jgi:AcrR family transcriptional regulator